MLNSNDASNKNLLSSCCNGIDSYCGTEYISSEANTKFKESNNVFALDSLIPIANIIIKIILDKNFIQLQSK